MKFVDAHFHLWNLDENYYPWLAHGDRPSVVADYSSLRRNYLVSDLLRDMDGFEVLAGVHIQAEHDPRDHVRETRWLQGVADDPASRGFPHAIVANVDLAAPDAGQVLEGHCAFRNMRGLRQAVHRRLEESPPYDPLLDPHWLARFALVEKHGLSFDLQLFPHQYEAAEALVRRYPGVQFILTHCGMPLWPDDERRGLWRRGIASLGRLPNVAVKISGFGMIDPAWDARRIEPIVAPVLEAFTPARCLLASNYPVERVARRYADVWRFYDEAFASCSRDEREAMFFGNALRLYRIDLPQPLKGIPMRLFTTPASPWVRRCVVSILELGLESKVERIPTRWPHSWATRTVEFAPEFIAATPVARIPALVTDDGLRLVDSWAICDYLNAEHGNHRLMPAGGRQRWEMLSTISIASGLLEAQISRRAELLRGPAVRSADFIEKMRVREHRCYDALEARVATFLADVDLAQITVAAACSYHDFRFKEDWKGRNPKLAAWFARFIQRPSMQATMPSETPQ